MIARSVPRKTESNAPIDRSVENYEFRSGNLSEVIIKHDYGPSSTLSHGQKWYCPQECASLLQTK
jgi:hypothetical protein